MPKYVVAREDEIPINSRKLVHVKGRPIAIFNIEGEYYAVLNRCPHQGGSLCDGQLIGLVESSEPGDYRFSRPGEILRCPWHGWEFDLKTGLSRSRPDEVKVRKYPVSTGPAEVDDSGQEPLRAETFEVSVEESYVFVEM